MSKSSCSARVAQLSGSGPGGGGKNVTSPLTNTHSTTGRLAVRVAEAAVAKNWPFGAFDPPAMYVVVPVAWLCLTKSNQTFSPG